MIPGTLERERELEALLHSELFRGEMAVAGEGGNELLELSLYLIIQAKTGSNQEELVFLSCQ